MRILSDFYENLSNSRLKQNTLWLVGGDALARLLGLLTTTILYARILGEEGFGIFGFAFAFSQLFLIFPDMGLHRWAVQHLAGQRENAWPYYLFLRRVKRGFALGTLIGGTALGAVFVKAGGAADTHLLLLLFLALAAVCLRGVKQNCETLFHLHQEMRWPAYYNVLFRFVTFAVTPLLIYVTHRMLRLELTISLLLLFGALLAIEYADYLAQRRTAERRYASAAPAAAPIDPRRIIRAALPFTLQMFTTLLYFHMDVLMLYLIHGDWEMIGYYNAGYRIVLAALVVPSSLCNALFPAMAQRRHEPGASLRIFRRSLPLFVLAGFGFVILIVPFSGFWVELLYGENQFADTVPLLGLLSLSFPLYCLTMAAGNYFGATLRQHWVMIVGVVMTCANLILNLLWIPRYAAYGAAMATVATELLVLLGLIGCTVFAAWTRSRG